MYFNWISTASFVALNKGGVKNASQLNYLQYKIDTASVYKVFCFQLGRIGHFEKQIKVISIEHLKQNLSLENVAVVMTFTSQKQ